MTNTFDILLHLSAYPPSSTHSQPKLPEPPFAALALSKGSTHALHHIDEPNAEKNAF
ncbi:hypothetical protein M413DRAFT_448635 [Hebeloma cylindrosporum]|uniref:Uncharacterized protein n=1 Tax=Hebeloma cylindrosporum TaxID=76867 RepID=A0A0C2Y8K4_HEBCY|nr:hypothetical protein M413DRAFT_448635 [Hebeloma cylindrosporum h7]